MKYSLLFMSCFRSWSPHSLPITDMVMIGASPLTLRSFTCSLDRAVVLYDIHGATQIFRLSLSEPIESLACNASEDTVLAGSSSGRIYCIDLMVAFHGQSVSAKNGQRFAKSS